MRSVSPMLALVLLLVPVLASATLDPALLSGLAARSIGPAGMSGRVADIVVVPGDPDVVFVGAATGGVWRSNDGGLTFEPIFDEEDVAAIGALAVHPLRREVLWVGTGEGNPRNSASVGNGVYRSLDGGRSWEHLGLASSERISRIRLHPQDPQVAFVAAMGPTWSEGGERGVYRTRDGGRSFECVLHGNDSTGAADLEMDPTNPDKLIAALWDHRRWPWFFRSGGPGSGLHLSYDGGDNWKRIGDQEGLPKGDLGRIGLAIAPSDPQRVYALIEAETNGIYRSDDGGESWRKVTDEGSFGNRPFYYADLRVDPRNADRVYSLWSLVSVSIDGGRRWEVLIPWSSLHPDHHAMWIDPVHPNVLWNGNDGGIGISRDYGRHWRFVANLPLAQFYHVATDNETPYNIYGGMQDNGSWRGPSSVWENGGIRNHHWSEVGFGDGFDTRPDPEDPEQGYSMSQEGFLLRWDLRTGERSSIRPVAPDDSTKLRFNWNAGFAQDPFEPGRIYFGSQFVHRSDDRGRTWTLISGDLTTDNPEWQKQDDSGGLTPDVTGAENFTTILAIAPSPLQPGLLWVGTDDGRVQLTRDGGRNWTSVESKLRGAPENSWVPHICASPHDPATAFVVLDDHRRGNWKPYVYVTRDHGRSFQSLATGDLRGYCLAIEQDPVDPQLLFLGTEFGLYLSLDGGRGWMPFRHGVPTVSVMDLTVHRRDADLVVATHGRAAFIVDDITPLRGLRPETLEEPLHLFPVAPAQQHGIRQTGASRFPGHGEFRGENRPYGALVSFSVHQEGVPHPDAEVERVRRAERQGEEAREEPKALLEILDEHGERIRRLERPVHLGLNRVVWDLTRDPFREPREEGAKEEEDERGVGLEVLPGRYGLRVKVGEHEATGTLELLADPRRTLAREEREQRMEALLRAGRLQESATTAIERIQEALGDLQVVERKRRAELTAADPSAETKDDPLLKAAGELREGMQKLEERLWKPPSRTKGYTADTDAMSAIRRASWFLASGEDAPSPAQLGYLEAAERRLQAALEASDRFFAEEVTAFRQKVEEEGLGLLPPVPAGGS